MTFFSRTAGSPTGGVRPSPAPSALDSDTRRVPAPSADVVGPTRRGEDGAAPRLPAPLSHSLPSVSAADGAKGREAPPHLPAHVRYEARWCNPCNSRGRLFIDGVCCMASYHEVGT